MIGSVSHEAEESQNTPNLQHAKATIRRQGVVRCKLLGRHRHATQDGKHLVPVDADRRAQRVRKFTQRTDRAVPDRVPAVVLDGASSNRATAAMKDDTR